MPPRRTSSELARDPHSLTVVHVSAVPRRNNEQYIQIYMKTQRGFLKQWALEGAKDAASWDSAPPSHLDGNDAYVDPPCKASAEGLGSPVLRARVPEDRSKQLMDSRKKKTHPLAESSGKQHNVTKVPKLIDAQTGEKQSNAREQIKTREAKNKVNNQSKRHAEAEQGDKEVEIRLAERRHRKKVKRDMMAPEMSDNDSQNEHRKKGQKARTTSAKTPTSFALMHGFSATNVGKNRLTLDRILHNTGVFKKGKASASAKTVKNAKDTGFSESEFLKKRKQSAAKKVLRAPSSTPSSASSSSSSCANSEDQVTRTPPRKRRRGTTKKLLSDARNGKRHQSLTSVSTAAPSKPAYNPADSIVWDIEKESHVTASASNTGTILVKMPHTFQREAITVHIPGPTNEVAHIEKATQRGVFRADYLMHQGSHTSGDQVSILSLGPSESASQVGKITLGRPPPGVASASKYFRPADISRQPGPIEVLIHTCNVHEMERHTAGANAAIPMEDLETSCDRLDIPDNQSEDLDRMLDEPHNEGLSDIPFSHEPCFWSQVSYDGDPQDVNTYSLDELSSDAGNFPIQYGYDIGTSCLTNNDDDIWLPNDIPLESDSYPTIDDQDYIRPPNQDFDNLYDERDAIWIDRPSPPSGDLVYGVSSQQDFTDDSHAQGGSIIASSLISSDLSTMLSEADAFQQGRELLYGFRFPSSDIVPRNLSSTEAEVAGTLRRNHWQPQRF